MENNHRRPAHLVALAVILFVVPCFCIAAGLDNLFEAEVPVSGQQPQLRKDYMKTAMEEVLVRVTGQHDVLGLPGVRSMLANPESYVEQFRYHTLSGPEGSPSQLMLRVRFDGEAIRTELERQGVAYWGNAERPDILVWLAVDDRGARSIVSADDDSDAHRGLEQAARQSGIPLLFPLLDLEDQSKVRFSDIWGGFFDGVTAASRRYSPQAVLIGRVNRTASGGWRARWDIPAGSYAGSWAGTGDGLDAVLQSGIDTLSGRLASRLAVTGPGAGASTGAVDITVEGVNSLAGFARVDDYLSSLTTVRHVQLVRVNGADLEYALRLNGVLDAFTQTVAIGTVLEPVTHGARGTYRLRQ